MGTQRTALITGGASGIGLATAVRLRDEGWDVVIADRDPRAAEVAAEIGVTAQALDVTDPAAWQKLGRALDAAEVELGAVLLNAGVAGGGTDLAALDLDRYHQLMRVNVDGVVYGLREMLPRLARPGVVTVTASLAGLMGVAPDPIYAMTKHAVIGLVRSVHGDLAGPGDADLGEQIQGPIDHRNVADRAQRLRPEVGEGAQAGARARGQHDPG